MKRYRLFTFITVSGLLLLACGLPEYIRSNLAQGGEKTPVATEISAPGIGASTALPTNVVPPDPVVTESPVTCLAGTWEITGIHEYVLAAIPPEMAEEYNLQYKGTNGKAYFTLSPDGQVVLKADGLEIVFDAQAAVFTVPVTSSVDGQAVGRYSVDGGDPNSGTLTTSSMDTSGLSASAQAMGQELVAPSQIIGAIPMLEPPANTAQFVCEGDSLKLRIAAYPANIPPLEFVRVE